MMNKKRISASITVVVLLFCFCYNPIFAHAAVVEGNPCIRQEKYEAVSDNDLEGLLNLAIRQTKSRAQENLLLNAKEDSITVEQVLEEKEYADGTIERSIAASLITIVDKETKKAVTRQQIQNGYESRLSGNFSGIQTIYATGLFENNLIQKVRCDKSTMVLYGAPNNIYKATQRLRIQGLVPVAEGKTIDISQTKYSPVNGQVYTLLSTNTRWYNVGGAMEAVGNLDVLLTDGHGGRSQLTILGDFMNPPIIDYY